MALDAKKLCQVTSCLACIFVAQKLSFKLAQSELSEGTLTGPLLRLLDVGSILLFLAILLTYWSRGIAAAIAMVACILCSPLYFYFAAPGPFQWVFKGEYAEMPQANFIADAESITALVMLAITIGICIWNFGIIKRDISPDRAFPVS